ncbi:hypothetical protein DUNSADRAFT_15915 [Dunaliella salina]|uniref:Uncharacterized protein n=1 Tax=Dunaliella salina TaxID=3046 RepID=A0ABQ7H1C9_DUNSA|nr:hypothetical protein DUNSADRAFT_15915 [Dunaliella salina]|eukprot:KAF5840672.1 hypothetical protein DUNSADRAFT_15915 [Dunaliella salina]
MQRDAASYLGLDTQGNFKPGSGLVLDPMSEGLKGTHGTSSGGPGFAFGGRDGRLGSSRGEPSSSDAGPGPGAAGRGGSVGGGGPTGRVFHQDDAHSARFAVDESSVAGGGGGAAGELDGGVGADGGGLGPSSLCCAGIAGVSPPKLAVSPPQGVSSMQAHDLGGNQHPQQQQQHHQEQQQFQQLPPQEYVNWEGETVYVTQETLEDPSGSPEMPTSFLAASPSRTQPPPFPAFAPSLPMAPSHMAPAPPSDWSISSTLPSSNPHPEYAVPTGPIPPLPTMYGSPRVSMQFVPAAAPSFPPTQAPLPSVYHSSPRESVRLGGEVDGMGMGSQQFRGGLDGLRAGSPRNPAAESFAVGMGSMQGLPRPPLPSQLAAPPAALPMQDPGLESQLAALQLSSRDMEQGLRMQLAEMEHLLKAKDIQLVAANNKADTLQAEVQAGQNRAEALQAELAIRDGRMDALQTELTAARKDLEQERLRGAEEGVGMDRLKAELLRLRNELEVAHKKLDMSSEDERRLRMEVQGLHKDNGMLSDATLQLKMEVSEGQERLRALFEDQQRFKAQAARAEVSSESMAAQVQEMRLRCISRCIL